MPTKVPTTPEASVLDREQIELILKVAFNPQVEQSVYGSAVSEVAEAYANPSTFDQLERLFEPLGWSPSYALLISALVRGQIQRLLLGTHHVVWPACIYAILFARRPS
jgi:hypothetical protein